MSKDKKTVPYEDVPRESESPAHRKRREEQQKLNRVKRAGYDELSELDDLEFDTFQPLKKRNGGRG